MARVIASIEARMGSSRFPGKVLADICCQPALSRLLRRLRNCKTLDGIILATTVQKSDDALEIWAKSEGVDYYRGSEEDVLLRVVEAQRKMKSDIVVEITGDCILIDPEIVDMGVQTFLENECDVVTNVRKLSYPMGMDIQVFSLSHLEEIERTVSDPAVREHVSLYFYEHPEQYKIIHLFAPARWQAPEYRFQLDYQEDYSFITEIYNRLEKNYGDEFGIEEIMALLKQEPSLVEINRYCEQYERLEQLMWELLLQVPNTAKLLKIKGVGLVTATTFVGETGDIHRFEHPRQIQKLAGCNLVENSSGKHKGKTTISHRGRKRLRHGLFMAMIAILGKNPEFQELHHRNLTREKNPLNKMQSIIALCGKLIRVFYAILSKGVDYDPEKMMGDIQQSMKAAA